MKDQIKIISLEKTIEMSNGKVPQRLYSADSKELKLSNYKEFNNSHSAMSLHWLGFIWGDPNSDPQVWAKRANSNNEIVNKIIESLRIEIFNLLNNAVQHQASKYQLKWNVRNWKESLDIFGLMNVLHQLVLEKPIFLEAQDVIDIFDDSRVAALHLLFLDNLYFCLEIEKSKNLIYHWDKFQSINNIKSNQPSLISLLNINSHFARKRQAASTEAQNEKYAPGRAKANELAHEAWKNGSKKKLKPMAESILDKVNEALKPSQKRVNADTVKKWIDNPPTFATQRGRPRNK